MPTPNERDPYLHIRLRRRPWYEWLGWLLWLVMLALLLDFSVSSVHEFETQAAVIAGLVFAFLLVGGLMVGLIQRFEARELDNHD